MGGGNDKASKAAARREDEERARVNSGISKINSLIDGPERAAGRDDYLRAVQDEYTKELNKVKGNTDLANKFALARSGQIGGSLQRDVATETGEAYQEGVLRAERGAQQDAAQLRSADEETRSRLISMIQSGADIGNAQQAAASQLQTNLNAARATNRVDLFGDVFNKFTSLAKTSKDQGDYRRGLKQGTSLYGPGVASAPGGW